MDEHTGFWAGIGYGCATVPFILATLLIVTFFEFEFLACGAALIFASVVLFLVKCSNQKAKPPADPP